MSALLHCDRREGLITRLLITIPVVCITHGLRHPGILSACSSHYDMTEMPVLRKMSCCGLLGGRLECAGVFPEKYETILKYYFNLNSLNLSILPG